MQTNKIKSKRSAIIFATILAAIIVLSIFANNITTLAIKPPAPTTIDPKIIPKFTNQFVVPPVYKPTTTTFGDEYKITMTTGTQQILPTVNALGAPTGFGTTPVWGYMGDAVVKGNTLTTVNQALTSGTLIPDFFWSPSATFETTKNTKVKVTWVNAIDSPMMFPVDTTLDWANPNNVAPFANGQQPVALVPHLHGAEDSSAADGGPDAWWTSKNTGFKKGAGYSTDTRFTTLPGEAIYVYDNAQTPNTLFYHDHALGITRLNVMSGLAGFYLIRDVGPSTATIPATVTTTNFDEYLTAFFTYGVNELPIAIQDRTFNLDGSMQFPTVGLNPTIHPYWMPEFFGDTIMVNGKVWPNLDVTTGWYRLRIVDGSNARFYTISLKDQTTGLKLPFIQIGADGGYLKSPVATTSLTIAPGERADILVDFSAIAPGTKILMENKAKAPFPNGAQPNPQTTGQIMQFTVWPTGSASAETQGKTTPPILPAVINPTLTGAFPSLPAPVPAKTRFITLNEVMGAFGPIAVIINGQKYRSTETETPIVGDTEDWVIINLTADTHPIHLHLVTFQLVNRQPFDAVKYSTAWLLANSAGGMIPFADSNYIPTVVNPAPYYKGKAILPTPSEMTWKDTIQMNPGEVTTIRVRFAPQDAPSTTTAGTNAFPFDPTTGNGYVWHCHIIDHEDNEMMRPLLIKQPI